MRRVEAALGREPTGRVRVEGLRASVALDGADPAAFLARALAAPDLPRPRAAEYGELSLADLYREIYGVEGC